MCVCVCVCGSVNFNSSETIGHTNIKLETIDHYSRVSVIKSYYDCVTIKDKNFFNLHFLTEEYHFLLKQMPMSNLEQILFFWGTK